MADSQQTRLSMFREATMRSAPTYRPVANPDNRRRSFNYKPTILRTFSLLSLFLVTVALIGVLEYVVEKLPHSNTNHLSHPLASQSSASPVRRDLQYRNDSSSDTISYVLASPTITSLITSASADGGTTSSSPLAIAASANSDDYLDVSYQQTVTAIGTQSDYVSTSYQVTITTSPVIASSAETSDYLNTDYTETIGGASYTTAGVYVNTDYTQTITSTPSVALSAQKSEYLNTDQTVTATSTAPTPGSPNVALAATQSAQVITSSAVSVVTIPISSGSPQSADGAVIALAGNSASDGPSSAGSSLVTVSLMAVTVTSGSSTYVQTQGVATVSGTLSTISSLSSVLSQFAQSTTDVQVVTTISPTPAISQGATATSATAAGSDGSSADSDTGAGKTYTLTYRFTPQQTFLGTYCAIAVAVLYRMIWTTLYNNFNLIEPFRQLAEPKGALADHAFFNFYQSQSNLLGPIPALMRRRFLMALTATAYLICCLLPALASEAVYVDTRYQCAHPKAGSKNPCPARLTVDHIIVRIMQACFAFIALAILVLATVMLLGKTGLPANPSSMATLASLMRNQALLDDLREVPADADENLMQTVLTGKRFRLEHYKTAHGELGYGIVPVSAQESDGHAVSVVAGKGEYAPVHTLAPWNDDNSHTHRWRFLDYVLAVVVAGTFGVLLAYYLDGNDDGFNNFFSSNTFGPRFILAGAGTIVAALWKSVEQSETIMAPFNRLARKATTSSSTISLTPHTTPVLATVKMATNGYLFVAAITCVTLLGEAANICLAGVPYATGQTWHQFLASIYISLGVFAIMIIMSVAVIISRTREPRIPRKPDTLGAVMSYMSGSRMLDDFEGFEMLDEETRDSRLRLLGKKYDFKVATRRDGKYAWAVDDNLARSSYQS